MTITCPNCGRSFKCHRRYRGERISCPGCANLVLLPRRTKWRLIAYPLVAVTLIVLAILWLIWPMGAFWPDRRPIGVLFLASTYHTSATNPRGWFNDASADFVGPGGPERFKKALLDYADRSIANLKKAGAQGAIVWDLEGEQYPHKTSFIGDPRLLNRLAPEMDAAADEFFKRFRDAGLRVGVTIRPQQLVFDAGLPRQMTVLDIERILLLKIDYAHQRWGATVFYVDSNEGFWRPDQVWQMRQLAAQHPDILMIPEHHFLPYWAFSAPYVALRRGHADPTNGLARKLFPRSFQALDIGGASNEEVMAAWHHGDILLFPAWYWNSACRFVQHFQAVQR